MIKTKTQAIHIKADGSIAEVNPVNGKDFKYEELRGFVGGVIEQVQFPDGRIITLHEEGKLEGQPVYVAATRIFREAFPSTQDFIVGDVLICDGRQIK